MASRPARLTLAALALTSVACVRGCTSSRPPIHINPSMDNQPKLRPQSESGFFYDGAGMRPLVPGTMAERAARLALVAVALSSVACVRGCTSSQPPIHINPKIGRAHV